MHATPGPRRIRYDIVALLALGALFVVIQYALPGLWPHPVRADKYCRAPR